MSKARMGKGFRSKGAIPPHYRAALRLIATGYSIAATYRATGIAETTLSNLLASPAASAYIERLRARIDAHRILLAATVPFMQLAHAIETGRPQAAVSPEAGGEGEAG